MGRAQAALPVVPEETQIAQLLALETHHNWREEATWGQLAQSQAWALGQARGGDSLTSTGEQIHCLPVLGDPLGV